MSRANDRHRRMVLLMQGRPGSPLYWKPTSISDWKERMEGRKDPYQHLIDTAVKAAEQMELVISRWESGDLAEAVRGMNPSHLRNVANLLEEHLKLNVRNRGERLEMHHHPHRPVSDYDRMFIQGAQENLTVDGSVEVDDESYTTGSDDPGEYVMAWLWVPNDQVCLRKRFRANVYAKPASNGPVKFVGTTSVMAFDQQEAQSRMLDEVWDSRLDSASCVPRFEWDNPEMFDWDIEVLLDPDEDWEVVSVLAASPEDAIAALKELHDNPMRYEDDNVRIGFDEAAEVRGETTEGSGGEGQPQGGA